MAKKTFLVDIDLNKNQLLNPVFQNLATDPTTTSAGQFYFNTASNKPKFYNGTAWATFGQTLSELGGEAAITAGTSAQYWRGDKTFQTLNTAAVPELTNLYFTNARVNTQVATYTGDVILSGTAFSLSTVNTNVGSFGGASVVPAFTVNAKGLITAATSTAVIAPSATLVGTVLNSTVVTSSLTTVGTIGTGTWNGSIIGGQYGGTGINNAGKTITLGGNLTTAGAFATTITTTAATSVTLPTSGTLYGTATSSISSLQLFTSLTDPNGSGTNVFGTSPTFSTAVLTNSASLNVFNTVATTVNAFGAATALSIGSATGNTTVNNNLVVTGNLTVNGTTEIINSTTLQVADKNIELGKVTTPTNVTADGGGITLKGATDKTFNWLSSNSAWNSSENMNVATGKTYKIGDNDVLALTGNIISIGGVTIDKTAGYITGGYWAGQTIGVNYGGTGFIDALGGITRKIVNTIATGATTTLSVNHGLTGGIVAQVYETGSGAVVECEIINSVAGTTTFNFNQIPTAGYYSYCIVG